MKLTITATKPQIEGLRRYMRAQIGAGPNDYLDLCDMFHLSMSLLQAADRPRRAAGKTKRRAGRKGDS